MSHGKIFQLASKPIRKDGYITPEDFYDNHDAYADWIGDEVEEEERKECIGYLASALQGLCELDKSGTAFVYRGGLERYLQEWVDAIHEKAQAITAANVLYHTPRATLRDIVSGTHKDTADRFVIKEYSGDYAEPMSSLIEFLHQLKPGDMLYIGGIVDFHY